MNWRMIVAGVVLFVLGVGVGGVAEHERVKHKSHKTAAPAASSTTTTTTTTATSESTTTTAAAAGWFGNATDACPALKRWDASTAAAYTALLKKASWASTQAVLLAQVSAASAAVRTLRPLATPVGRTELDVLTAYLTTLHAAAQHATSVSAFSRTQRTLTVARVSTDSAFLTRAGDSCPSS